jgi:chromosome segregation ATPase
MIALARIVVVNWYLWEAMEFEIRGNLAVVGPNASGKSALLDAVQTAYFGGNKRLMEYNASASDKKRSKRSLRGYCLGQVRDLCYPPERTSATTHVCIVFRDGATGHETSAGISLTADVSDADEVIHGRFVVPGTGLTLADFTDRADGLVIPRTWKAVKKSLEGRCKIQECNAEAHFKALIFETKGSHRPDEAKVIRTFRNAVTFDPINDPTEFVRTYILDSAAIAVTRVRENIRHYEQIRQQIGGIKERGASLRKVDASARRIAAALAKAAALEWAGAQLAVEGCDAEAEAAQGILDGLEMQAAAAGEAAADMEQPLAGARSEHLELVAQRNASDVPTRIALEEARQAQAAAEFKVAEDSVSAVGGVLAAAAQLAQRAAGHSAADSMARATAGAAALLAATAGNTGRLAEIAEQADAAVLGISGALDGLAGVAAARDAASREAHDLGARLRDLRAGIREAEAGSSILSPETRHLRDVLASSGIGAEPICNMMEITDERWRDATETLLGSRREMLVVPADRVGDAVRLLRREGIRSAGAHILDPRQTARMQRRATSGSLASVIATDDPDVRAIVVSTIGSCRMVERDDELTGAERSVTADLAYASGGSITRLKPPYGGHKIGRGSSAAALPRLKAEETDTAARLRVAERRQADLESLRTGFESLAGGIQRLKGTAADGASRMAAAAASGEECRRRIGLLRQEDDSALVARIAELADGILSTESLKMYLCLATE